MSIWLWIGIGVILVFISLLIIIWLLPEDKIEKNPFLRTVKNCCKRFMKVRENEGRYF